MNWNNIDLETPLTQIVNSNLFMRGSVKLKQVIVHSRHGARTTAWELPPDFEENFEPNKKEIFIEGIRGNYPGQLTTVGARQMKDIGEKLQWFYGYKLGFLTGPKVALFCTHIQRTSDSLTNLMKGLFPNFKENHVPQQICEDLSVTSRSKCPMFGELVKSYFETENYKNWKKNVYDPQKEKVKTTTRESQDINSGILYDRFETHRQHSNSSTPSLIPEDVHELLEQKALRDWYGPYFDYPEKQEEITQLAVNRLLKKTSDDLKLAASSESDIPQMLIHVSHDTTLAPFLANYGLLNERWPQFASTFILELWERDDKSFLVRVIYNEKVMAIQKCKDQWVEGGTFCPLERFLELTKYTTNLTTACIESKAETD